MRGWGADGILPFSLYLDNAWWELGYSALLQVPGIFWLSASDSALEAAALAGVLLSLLLLWGRWQLFALIVLFVLYLSFYRAG